MTEQAVAVRTAADNLPAKLTDDAIARILENMKQWEKFKTQALSSKDKIHLGENEYVEKSGWVKLAMAMNVSFEVLDEGRRVAGKDEEGDYYTWIFKGRASLPGGRYVQMDGACSSRDEFFSMRRDEEGVPVRRRASEIDEKDIVATAQTNCFNRCMAFLMGFGEVSAEELRGKQFAKKVVTFPFGEYKGKEPRDLDPVALHKELAFWQKQAADPKNKFAAANQKLVGAIQEALAEKTAPAQAAAPGGTGAADPGVEKGAQQPLGAPPPSQPTEMERAWAQVREAREALGWSTDQVKERIAKLWPITKGAYDRLTLLEVQALAVHLREILATQGAAMDPKL